MSDLVVHAVFDILELRTAIIRKDTERMWYTTALRRLHQLKSVCRTFQSTATFLIYEWYTECLAELSELDKCVQQYRSMNCAWSIDPPPRQTPEHRMIVEHSKWALCLYNHRGRAFRNPRAINLLHWYRVPQSADEFTHQCLEHCYVCGTKCKHYAQVDSQGHWDYAVFVHPYEGKHEFNVSPCGCGLHSIERSFLPHTHSDEVVEAFFEHRAGNYCVRPLLSIHPRLAERHLVNFLFAASKQPWFNLHIMRLFAMRPAQLQPCPHQAHYADGYESFNVSLPLYAPAIDLGPDSSYAQIFGLTSEAMRRLISVGGRMRKEERLMWT